MPVFICTFMPDFIQSCFPSFFLKWHYQPARRCSQLRGCITLLWSNTPVLKGLISSFPICWV